MCVMVQSIYLIIQRRGRIKLYSSITPPPREGDRNSRNTYTQDLLAHGQNETRKILESGIISGFIWRARIAMFKKFMYLASPSENTRLLDVGPSPAENKYENYIEKLYPFPHKITLCGIEDCSHLVKTFGLDSFVFCYDGHPLPFPDNAFDVVFCNAVVEHVGDFEMQASFIAELIRVGKRVFFTTPNRYFPVELHTMYPFIHWLPRRTFQSILRAFGKTFYAKTENLNLLTKKQLIQLLPENYRNKAHIYMNTMLGIPANIICWIIK